MVEKKIYNGYAFTADEREKGQQNAIIHRELTDKYKVYRNDIKINIVDGEDCNFDDYDIVIGRKPGYGHALYRIYKNTPKLTTAELALLCDHGSLCFGYGMQGDFIRVSED